MGTSVAAAGYRRPVSGNGNGYGFLLRPRWLGLALAVLLLAAGCVVAGRWQYHRHVDRAARNAIIDENLAQPPVPLAEVLGPAEAVGPEQQWRSVVVEGRFDADDQLLLRLRPQDGQAGSQVLTPLVTATAAVVLVDRGWTADTAARDVDALGAPPPPSGPVEAVVRLRASEPGRGLGGDPDSGAIRTVDVELLDAALPYDLIAWGDLVAVSPPQQPGLTAVPAPETSMGPHLAYSVQWYIFAAAALVGYGVLARSESRGGRPQRPAATASPPGPPGPADASSTAVAPSQTTP